MVMKKLTHRPAYRESQGVTDLGSLLITRSYCYKILQIWLFDAPVFQRSADGSFGHVAVLIASPTCIEVPTQFTPLTPIKA